MTPCALALLAASWAGAEPALPSPRAIHDAARRILAVSRVPARDAVRLRYYAEGLKSEDVDGKPVVGVPEHLKFKSAGAMAPRIRLNTLDTAVIYWTPRLYAYAKTLDEAAFIMAHEVAHLELEHARRYDEAMCAMYREWKKKAVPCVNDPPDFERFAAAMAAPRERLKLMARASEYEADQRAMRLATAAGFDARVFQTVLERAAAMRAEPGFTPTEYHPDPADRLAHVRVTALPEVLADQAAW